MNFRDAETGLLSALMNPLLGEHNFEKLLEKFEERDLSVPGHRQLYTAVTSAFDITGGKDMSVEMIWSQIVKNGHENALEKAGITRQHIEDTQDMRVPYESAEEYAKLVNNAGSCDRLAQIAGTIFEESRHYPDVTHLAARLDKGVMDALGKSTYGGVHISEVANDILRAVTGEVPMRMYHFYTGNPIVDTVFDGLKTGKILYIAAPSHHGKTTLLNDIAFKTAYYNRDSVVVAMFKLEESKRDSVLECISFWTHPDSPWVISEPRPRNWTPLASSDIETLMSEDYEATPDQLAIITNAVRIANQSSIEYYPHARDRDSMSTALRRTARKYPDHIIMGVVDYQQLVQGSSDSEDSVRIHERTNAFYRSALEQEMDERGCWVITSQLRGDPISEYEKDNSITSRTMPSEVFNGTEMKGSSALFQTADGVLGTLIPAAAMMGGSSRAEVTPFNWNCYKDKIKGGNAQMHGTVYRHGKTGRLLSE